MDKNSPVFTIEYQFSEYTKRVKLDKSKVNPVQWIETRRAFFGAAAQILYMFRDDLAELTEDEGVEALEKMLNEVVAFWQRENNRQN